MIELNHIGMKIIAISDTHGLHSKIDIPNCDILIHCGDACTDGNEEQLLDFFSWFSVQKASYKIFVAGNHDLIFDLEPSMAKMIVPKNVIYLENKQTLINKICFYSIPARPWLHEDPIVNKKIDFLLTHGPAYSILDEGLGCSKLLTFVNLAKPKYHLFGHIHQTSNQSSLSNFTQSYNVCINSK